MIEKLRDLAARWVDASGIYSQHAYAVGRNDCAAELLAILDAEGDKWRPIETAPSMETIILFAHTHPLGHLRNWKMATGYRRHDGAWIWEGDKVAQHDWQPTHWRPLPPPPRQP